MSRRWNIWLAQCAFVIISIVGCGGVSQEKPATTVSRSFESGSIGKVERLSDTEWEISLADDNQDASLPASWRSWWYVKMDHLELDTPTKITLKNSGWPYYYLPVYSYDQKLWLRFSQGEVTQNTIDGLTVTKQFEHSTVWLARFYPYTYTDLERYLETIQGKPYVDVLIAGHTQQGQPIYLLKVTDRNVPAAGKKRVVMHARTHPAETGPSFLIEGLMAKLLSGSQDAARLLSGFEFYIFPMQNVDGVVAGNYRSTPKSENLEMSWTFDSAAPLELTGHVPPEVTAIHHVVKSLMSDGGPPVSMALNLHASNSEPDVRTFFFPHFGAASMGYQPTEAALWDKQLLFIETLAARLGAGMVEPMPEQGGAGFATKTYPESWWWANYQDRVLAMTMEMTYGRAGYAPRWISQADMRDMGGALVMGIGDFYSGASSGASSMLTLKYPQPLSTAPVDDMGGVGTSVLRYPQIYPPKAIDELKE